MQTSNPNKLDAVFLPKDCPTFGDLLAKLEVDDTVSKTRARDMTSGLRRVAKALGREPHDVFCEPRWLQPRVAKVVPAAIGLSAKGWQNAVSDARAAMTQFGFAQRKHNRVADLGPTWQSLWQQVLNTRDKSVIAAIGRFVYFLDRLGIDPNEVSDDHAAAFKAGIEEQEISRSPEVAFRAAVNGWNLAQSRCDFWPRQRLTLPSRVKTVQLPAGVLPKRFATDVEAYLSQLGASDPFAPEGPTRGVRPDTIIQYRRLLMRFAAHMVAAGTDPAEIDGVAALLEPARVERTLRMMLEQNGQKTSQTVSSTAGLLFGIAKRIQVPEDWQTKLGKMAKRVALPSQDAMTQKNRTRLRALQDDKNLLRLLDLPEQLFSQKRGVNAAYLDALAREDAVAIAILVHCPLRVKNLSRIHLELNLQRPGDGSAFLVFESDEVKNHRPIEFELPREVIAMIDRHLKTRVPLLCPAGTPWLFPKRDGTRPVGPSELGLRIFKRIRKETGLAVNVHLFRHLAAMLYLEARPGAYEAAGRLIGHSNTPQEWELCLY